MIQTWENFQKTFDPVIPGEPGPYTQGRHLSVVLTLAVHRKPRKILEIGTAYGHTTVALAQAVPTATVFSVDVCKELGGYDVHSPYAHEVPSMKESGSQIRNAPESVRSRICFEPRRGSDIPHVVRGAGPFEYAFIDGDHTWRRVVNDTKLVLETLVDDGVVVWDDYQPPCPEIIRFIDTLNDRAGDLISLVEGSRVAYALMSTEKKAKILNAISDL